MSDLSKKQILVIDDDPIILSLMEVILVNLGIEKILMAADVPKALETFTNEKKKTDLIICDWMMPEISGLQFLEMVRMVDKKVPFLMMTSNIDKSDVLKAGKLGATKYLKKPFSPDHMKENIVELLCN